MFSVYLSEMISCYSLHFGHSLEEDGESSLQLTHFGIGRLFLQLLHFVGILGTLGNGRATLLLKQMAV